MPDVGNDQITRRDLLRRLEERGIAVNDRRLSGLITEGLVRPGQRDGKRAGMYPAVTVDLIEWIIAFRARGYSHTTIRELVPLWETLTRQFSTGVVNVRTLELAVADHVVSVPAAAAVSVLVRQCVARQARSGQPLTLVARSGESVAIGGGSGTIGFIVELVDPVTGEHRELDEVRIVLSDDEGDETSTVRIRPAGAWPGGKALLPSAPPRRRRRQRLPGSDR